ncbi:toll/interleukin-1 receptor domain-containing protein [Microbacterium sp. 2P01SA-2]|uniref:toll/interleukin-1 receptor domain-containing protein n=1 Tax=unclassified Microbacterium TaxID=2609290 RepID=UPI00399FC72F
MQVFISWSGEQTRELGYALKLFLDTAFAGHVSTFLSDADIAPGERFLAAINSGLDDAELGILLVTHTNQRSPWLLFEAGALASKTTAGSVIPILVDVDRAELDPPLSQFQNVIGTSRDSLVKLCARILNESTTAPGETAHRILFEQAWPALHDAVERAKQWERSSATPRRDVNEMLEEILLSVNSLVLRKAPESAFDLGWQPPSSRVRNNTFTLRPGDEIEHEQFGHGRVSEVTGEGSKAVAHVTFDLAGFKKILVKIAPIRVIER